jgi:hypothetical protein
LRLESFAANELHDHQPVRADSQQLVDRRNFRVAQSGERRRFRTEPFDDVGVCEEGIQGLDRNFAIERLVDGFVDDARRALSQVHDNAVLADARANHCIGEVWLGVKLEYGQWANVNQRCTFCSTIEGTPGIGLSRARVH